VQRCVQDIYVTLMLVCCFFTQLYTHKLWLVAVWFATKWTDPDFSRKKYFLWKISSTYRWRSHWGIFL